MTPGDQPGYMPPKREPYCSYAHVHMIVDSNTALGPGIAKPVYVPSILLMYVDIDLRAIFSIKKRTRPVHALF